MRIVMTASRPAAARKAIAFCCDEGYLPYALMAAQQIDALHPDRDFDILLCSSDPLPALPPGLEELNLRLCRFAAPGLFDGLRLDAGRTQVVYLRLALPEALAADYDRLLYLDSDIFVQNGDFGALLDLDLGGHAVGAVRDTIQWRSPQRRPEQFRRLGLATARYFNAGVMLIDLALYNQAAILDRCIALGRAERAVMIRHDQNLLNAVLQGRWAELSPVWNWQYSWSARLFEAMVDANIVHFIGGDKPWKDRHGRFPPRFARACAAFVARHFPSRPAVPVGRGPARDTGYMRRMLLRQFLSAGRMRRYLDRFPHDRVVVP